MLKYSFLALVFFGSLTAGLNAQEQSASTSAYKLSTGDSINIVVFEEPDMSFEIKIDESGVFTYPYLDDIQLAGKTTEQLENSIADGLRGRVLINPNISVSITEYRPFSIGGEVNSPGSYPYEPGLNIQKAINIAGGVTEWASSSRFRVDKENGNNTEEQRLSLETLVSPGDTITVLPRRF